MAQGKPVPLGDPAVGRPLPVRWVVLFYGVVGGVAVAWRLLADGVLPWRAPGASPDSLGLRLAAGLATGLGLVVASRLATTRSRAARTLADELARLVGPLTRERALGFALASGLAEEAFFRGALQPRVGLVAATLLFAAAHYVPRPGLRIWSLFALAAGALFGVLFERTGDLLAPALAHTVVNGLNLYWLAKRTGVPRPRIELS